ncbi:Exosome component EXOSC1/CSL4 domain containing protein [Elaphomyces granulatus]
MMATSLPKLAVPGQPLAPVSSHLSGPGTHIHGGVICASITGPVIVDSSQSKPKLKPVLSVSRTYSNRNTAPTNSENNNNLNVMPTPTTTPTAAKAKLRYNTLPVVDSMVLTRVTRVQKRQATVSILVVLGGTVGSGNQDLAMSISPNDNITSILTSAADPENHSSSEELRFQALIRKEDVRAVEKDRVVMEDMFRVGDIVRGTVISLGDQSFYYLTTARNDLGVVMARSEAGNMMFPVSWREMRDPVTGAGESRKVARPF